MTDAIWRHIPTKSFVIEDLRISTHRHVDVVWLDDDCNAGDVEFTTDCWPRPQ